MGFKLLLIKIYKDIIKILRESDFNILIEIKIKILGFIYQYKNAVIATLLLSLLTIILYIFFGQAVVIAIIVLLIFMFITQVKK
ncbi:hypothetical protein LGK97_08220 [Clostridium sp. CS001]|uniref:hypothetical protein n=1 Tax=Clostridium sp. CS001 TaxID=2880648 RepID=UPI001CF0EA37|nr:hypothetical protein [Clostridium sp. CS001]MCB2289749.1 hypothetical protein [Clostridium sp. CS001]